MISFLIHNVKPCSINAGYYKTKRVLTVDGRRYRKRLLITMNRNPQIKQQLQALRASFDPDKHALKVQYYFYIPVKAMYLKGKGALSRLGGDVDNYMKLTTDFLFNPKYMGHAFPNTENVPPIENVAIDDQFIASIKAEKLPNSHDFYSIGVRVSVVHKDPKGRPEFKEQSEYLD